MVFVVNFVLLLVMSSFDGSHSTELRPLFQNPALRQAILEGSIESIERSFRLVVAESLSADVNAKLGRKALASENFWSLLVNPEWIDLSGKIMSLSPQLIALSLVTEVLKAPSLEAKSATARSLAHKRLPELGLSYKQMPSLYELGDASNEERARRSAERLQKFQNKLASRTNENYEDIVDELAKRARRHRSLSVNEE